MKHISSNVDLVVSQYSAVFAVSYHSVCLCVHLCMSVCVHACMCMRE
jgi:hypothetical protein